MICAIRGGMSAVRSPFSKPCEPTENAAPDPECPASRCVEDASEVLPCSGMQKLGAALLCATMLGGCATMSSGSGSSAFLQPPQLARMVHGMGHTPTAFGKPGFDAQELYLLGTIVQDYLKATADTDPEACGRAVKTLLASVQKSDLEFTPRHAGVVTGGVLAGMMRHYSEIREGDEFRNRMFNGLFDAASAGGGVVPAWGPLVGAAIIGLRTIYLEADLPRDFSAQGERLRGTLELEWLQNPPADWNQTQIHEALFWMSTTIRNNAR